MQILYTYSRLYPSSVLETAPRPPSMHLDPTDGRYKPVTWLETGQFVACGETIVFQWRGTFDHEREAERQLRKERIAKLQSIGKEAAEMRDENAFWEDWKKRMGEHNEAVESEGPPECTCPIDLSESEGKSFTSCPACDFNSTTEEYYFGND